ncbi:MAG: hypothetical protein RR034_02825 [Bacteroidales bacterium]
MKKIIVILGFIIAGIVVLSSCDTQKKCAAYGHYAQYEVTGDTPADL